MKTKINDILIKYAGIIFLGTITINMSMGMSTMFIEWDVPDSIFTLTLPLGLYALLLVITDPYLYGCNRVPDKCPPPPPRDPSTMRREDYPGGYTNPSPTTKPLKPSPYVAKPGPRTIVEQ